MIVLPQPGGDLNAWARRLTAVLQQNLGGQSGGSPSYIYDSQGRPLVTPQGIYVYSGTGANIITPDYVHIDTDQLVDAAITTAKIADLAISTDKLKDLAVAAAKLADSAVTATKIANAAVGNAAIANAAVGTAEIQDAAIISALIADAAIVTAKIDDLAVNDAKISSLSAAKIIAGVIGAGAIYLGDDSIELDGANTAINVVDRQTARKLRVKIGKLGAGNADYGLEIYDSAGNVILSSGRSFDSSLVNIAGTTGAGALASADSADWATQITGTGKPENNADVTANNTAAGIAGQGAFATLSKITAANAGTYIADAAIGTAYIANAAITNALIASAAVGNAEIANAAITSAKIGNGQITNAKIANGAITNAKISNAAITNAKIDNAAVDTLKIAGQAVTIPVSSHATSQFNVPDSWTTILSATINSSGATISIVVFVNTHTVSSGLNPDVATNWRFMRDSVQLFESRIIFNDKLCFAIADTPGSGTHTYRMQAYDTVQNSGFTDRTIVLLETKR